jgi:hypothetical protein
MKKFYLFVISLLFANLTFAQLELGAGFSSLAASDGILTTQDDAFQVSIDYDFIKDSSFRVALGGDVVFNNGGTFLMPGLKLGWDFINLKVNYELDGDIMWYGLGSRIGFGDKTHGITLSLQGAAITDSFDEVIGLGWGSIGYSYRF